MSDLVLSRGCISQIVRGQNVDRPVVQLLAYKALNDASGNENRFRFIITDGEASHAYAMMINGELIERIKKGEFEKFTVVRLDSYTANHVNSDKTVIVLQEITVLAPGHKVGRKLEGRTTRPPSLLDPENPSPLSPNRFMNIPDIFNPKPELDPVLPKSSLIDTRYIVPINVITPYNNAWVIKGRIQNKGPLREYSNARGQGKVFSFDVLDDSSSNNEIRITGFNEQADKFYEFLEIGKVYYITKGSVKPANKKFTSIRHDYEISLNRDTIIEVCEEGTDNIPEVKYSFKQIGDIANMEISRSVDVIGVLKRFEEVQSITSKKTQKELKKRDLYLMDKSGLEIRFTLWNDEAEKFDARQHDIIAVRGAIIGEFNGKTLASGNSTVLKINPDIPEATMLKVWFDTEGKDLVPSSLQTVQTGQSKYHFISEGQKVRESETFYFNCKATIQSYGRNPLYKACVVESCKKKVRDLNNGFYHCDKCDKDMPTFQYRMILSINIGDVSGDCWASVFQEQGEKILGIKTEELGKLFEEENNGISSAFTSKLEKAPQQSFYFRLGSKQEVYNNQSRVKNIVYNIAAIDPVKHSKLLLQQIRSWNK